MTAWDCAEARLSLGVYVLGIIDDRERELLDAHLATCPACQAELAELAGLPAMLALVPAGEAIALAAGLPADAGDLRGGPPVRPDPPPGRGHRPGQHDPGGGVGASGSALPATRPGAVVHDLPAGRRRRQRLARVAMVAAAAVVAGAASFGGVKLAAGQSPSPLAAGTGLSAADPHPHGQPAGPWEAVTGHSGQATATIAYRTMGWGTQLDALVTGIPVRTRCQMWVVLRNGSRVQAAGWETDANEGAVWYPASASVPAAQVSAFVIAIGGNREITVTRV
jgi:hypothetical protein